MKFGTSYDTVPRSPFKMPLDKDGNIRETDLRRVQEHFENDVDINQIMERSERGIMPKVNNATPRFGDFTNIQDYHSSLIRIQEAQADFETLDAKIRDRFRNNPANLIRFLNDPENRSEAIELGLIDKPKEEIKPENVMPAKPPLTPPNGGNTQLPS